jgi:addiction module RelE/StbE family toxin
MGAASKMSTTDAREAFSEVLNRAAFRHERVVLTRRPSMMPRPSGVKALHGEERGYLRLRAGDYRIVYRIEDQKLLVVVVRLGHRREVYR